MLVCVGRSIALGGNNLVGDLPLSLTSLTGLSTLSLGGNSITSVPAQVRLIPYPP